MNHEFIRYLYFVGVKAVGYTATAPVIKRIYDSIGRPWVISVGLTRTVIGIGVGAACGGSWTFIGDKFHLNGPFFVALFLGLLLPIRLVESGALVKVFFDRSLSNQRQLLSVLVGGTIWSYCLDAIGIYAAFALPGGAWIC